MPDRYYRPCIGITCNITLKIIRVIVRGGGSRVFIDGIGRSKALQYSSSTNSKKSRKDGTILLFLNKPQLVGLPDSIAPMYHSYNSLTCFHGTPEPSAAGDSRTLPE